MAANGRSRLITVVHLRVANDCCCLKQSFIEVMLILAENSSEGSPA